jgi:hypothetical protein
LKKTFERRTVALSTRWSPFADSDIDLRTEFGDLLGEE